MMALVRPGSAPPAKLNRLRFTVSFPSVLRSSVIATVKVRLSTPGPKESVLATGVKSPPADVAVPSAVV